MFENKFPILAIFLLIFLTVGIASASENITDERALDDQSSCQCLDEAPSDEIRNNESLPAVDVESKTATKIETCNVNAYYKENSKLVGYLKDNGGQPVSHKRVSISINEKTYEKITDDDGKILLKLNLKPGTYSANIKFDGMTTSLQAMQMRLLK